MLDEQEKSKANGVPQEKERTHLFKNQTFKAKHLGCATLQSKPSYVNQLGVEGFKSGHAGVLFVSPLESTATGDAPFDCSPRQMGLTFLAIGVKLSTIELKATACKFEDRIHRHGTQEFGLIVRSESGIGQAEGVEPLMIIPLGVSCDLFIHKLTLCVDKTSSGTENPHGVFLSEGHVHAQEV